MEPNQIKQPVSENVVLLPTYNERENLLRIVPAILAAAPVDIWILDDASPDGTGELGDTLAAQYPQVSIIHRPGKLGLGPAYVDGFQRALKAGYQRLLQMDADFSHPPSSLARMLELSQTYDVVLGSRWVLGGGTKNWPLVRQLISRGGSWYARSILGVPIRDLTGGFKCIRRSVLESLDLVNIRSTGYSFQIEITYRAIQKGFTVVETPFVFIERADGVSKMNRRIVFEAVIRVWGLRFGKPPLALSS